MTAITAQGAIRLGSRRSPLALAQSGMIAAALSDAGWDVTVVEVVTEGDRSMQPMQQIGGTGIFVSALRDQLRDGAIDVAVHSLKDLPTEPADDLELSAVPPREDPRDALVGSGVETVATLPSGARVGTGSPRRAAQLLRLRPDISVQPIRGNIDTRVGKVRSGELDAVVLAAAGLRRLGRAAEISELIDSADMLPAPGQGALAVECRSGELAVRLRDLIDHEESRVAVTAERALLATLEAGCSAPVGALATMTADQVRLTAVVVAPDGSHAIRHTKTAPLADCERLGRELAEELLGAGAAGLIGDEK